MAGRKLVRIPGLGEAVPRRLANHRILTVEDLFRKTRLDLVAAGFYVVEIDHILQCVCRAITPPPTTVLTLLRGLHLPPAAASSSAGQVDKAAAAVAAVSALSLFPSLKEFSLVGAAGLGKTQAAMTLSVEATVPLLQQGKQAGVIYLDTEGAFSPSRLVEIARTRFPAAFAEGDGRAGDGTAQALIEQLLGSVHVISAATGSPSEGGGGGSGGGFSGKQLLQTLEGLQGQLIEGNTRLLVVDSIANPVRSGGYGQARLPERQQLLGKVAGVLKRIGERLKVPVLVTNQVTANFSSETAEAALGVAWAHAVTTRFTLRRLGGAGGGAGRVLWREGGEAVEAGRVPGGARVATVTKSPRFATSSQPYCVETGGYSRLLSDPPLVASHAPARAPRTGSYDDSNHSSP